LELAFLKEGHQFIIMSASTSEQKGTAGLLKGIHNWLAQQIDDQKPKGTIASLDGVRAIACIIVVLYHSTSLIYWRWDIDHKPLLAALNYIGARGVTLFFVLSGFLLFLPYAKAFLSGKNWPQARTFYMRRILRIVPGYYFALFAIILLKNSSYLQPHNWKTLFSFLTFFMTHPQSDRVNGVYWTLAVEFQYYMLLPLIALGIYGLTRLVHPKRRLWVVIGSLFVMITWGLATRSWGDALFASPDGQTQLASSRILRYTAFLIYGDHGKFFEDFGIGMLLALLYVVATNPLRGDIYRRVLSRLSPWLWWGGIVLFAFAAWRNASNLPTWPATFGIFDAYPGWAVEFTFALGCACCMLAILFNGTGLLNRFFIWTPLRWIGLISFSLYLWHDPIIVALEANLAPSLFQHFHGLMTVGIFAVVECILILAVSFTLYVLVEKPGMRLSERLRNKNRESRERQDTARLVNTLPQKEEPEVEKTAIPT
jgi:peptidoglycan/LPS O-acetylase OafA/YrhL